MFKDKKNYGLLVLLIICLFTTSALFVGCGQNNESTPEANNSTQEPEAFPSKPIQLIVPFGAGGASDVVARTVASVAEPYLGQPLVVSIKAGAAGSVGAKYVVDSESDGYTLLMGAPGPLDVKCQMADVGYDYNDLIPIAQINANEIVLVVNADSPIKTFEDFIKYAEENPGEVTVGNSGAGSYVHLASAALFDAVGVEVNHVPMGGGGPGMLAVLGGEIDAAIEHPTTYLPQIEAGNLRPLVVLEPERLDILPDVPTAKELGYDIVMASWKTIFVPAGTPQETVDILREGFKNIIEDESFNSLLIKLGTPKKYMDGPDFQKTWEAEYKQVGNIIEKLGLKED